MMTLREHIDKAAEFLKDPPSAGEAWPTYRYVMGEWHLQQAQLAMMRERFSALYTGDEVFRGLESWLKQRRDEQGSPENPAWWTIDHLLDELRDNAVVGTFPWQEAVSDGD